MFSKINLPHILSLIKKNSTISVLVVLVIMSIIFGAACPADDTGNDTAEETTNNSTESYTDPVTINLSSKYDFYFESIEVLMDEMEIDLDSANTIFQALIDIDLDEEISYCFDDSIDAEHYTIWWGLTRVEAYITDDGTLKKITDRRDNQLYPIIEETTEATIEETEFETQESSTITETLVVESPAENNQEPVVEQPQENIQEPVVEQPQEPVAYITDTGDKYHRSSCRFLDESKTEITLNDALNRGYVPCKVCKP